jgi:hypothetical protein
MKIKFSISVNEFWNLAQERGWLTKADAFKGREINSKVDWISKGNNEIRMLELKIKDLSEIINQYSNDTTEQEIADALLTIVTMNTFEEE